MTLCTTSGSLGIPCYITLIDSMAHSRDVDEMAHDKTQHDSVVTLVLLLVCMSAIVLLGDGCPHGIPQLYLHMGRCTDSSMVIGFA